MPVVKPVVEKHHKHTFLKLPKNNTGAAIGGAIMFVLIAVLGALLDGLRAGTISLPQGYEVYVPLIIAAIGAIITVGTPHMTVNK